MGAGPGGPLPVRRPALRDRALPRRRPRPLGGRAPRGQRLRQRRAPPDARRLLPAARLPERDRDDRARRLALAEPADGVRRDQPGRDERVAGRRPGRSHGALHGPMTTHTVKPAGSRRSWPVPAALIALVTVPVIAGVLRLVQLSGGAATMQPNPRYDASPVPVVVHIVSALVFALAGAFQFVPRLRRRRRAWHRRAGRVVVVAGLGVALSALWPNQ